jgi:predicted P-loop ATPase
MKNGSIESGHFRKNFREFPDKSLPIGRAAPVYETRTALKNTNNTIEFEEKSLACHLEAERLLKKGFKLITLHPFSKRPVGDGWQLHPVTAIDPAAGGYGLMLAANGLCSIDPDNLEPARAGFKRCGFDLEELMNAGVRTGSTRPGSGGRSTFKAPTGVRWITFATKTDGTILELRATSTNLQDCLPGTEYRDKSGENLYRQDYVNGRKFDDATDLPPKISAWWLRMCDDVEYRRGQQILFCGAGALLAVSSGDKKLAFSSGMRVEFNAGNDVEEILERHDYTTNKRGRWAPPTATGAASVRPIPGRDGLWQSDHASDPLHGTFDAWTAFVVLDHNGDLAAAEAAWQPVRTAALLADFPDNLPAANAPEALPAFKRNAIGEIKATKDNIVQALNRPDVCGYQLRHDKFRNETMLAQYRTEGWKALKDTDYTELCLRLERGGFQSISKESIRDVVAYTAEANTFDSAQHWLEGLQWDGKPRIERFLQTYFSAADTPYSRAVALYFWTAAAGRVLQPGIKCDMVPIAFGAQGARKSSAVAALVPAPDFYTSIDMSSRDDDLARIMRGKLIIELDELKGLSSRDAESIKSFISRPHEEWTPKYRELTVRYMRRNVFFGTTNKDDFLADETGNRRWLPFQCGMCDPDAIARDREQLWAEARDQFKARGVLHEQAERLAKNEHAAFAEHDVWDDVIFKWLHTPDFAGTSRPYGRDYLTASEVLIEALDLPKGQHGRVQFKRVKKALLRLGYTYENKRIDGAKTRGFEPPSLF